jgi:hypothetical protein
MIRFGAWGVGSICRASIGLRLATESFACCGAVTRAHGPADHPGQFGSHGPAAANTHRAG